MITIKDFMEIIEYKVSDGAKYQWDCYGHSAWTLTHDDYVSNTTIFIVFDTVEQTVYEMQAWDGLNKREYRWIHESYIDAHAEESTRRNVPIHQSIDERSYIELDVEEDILEKARCIFKGMDYDDRVMVQLNLTKDDQHRLMQMAHEKDMSLNKFIEHILFEYIRKQEEKDKKEVLVA